jgi:hypothetical protein
MLTPEAVYTGRTTQPRAEGEQVYLEAGVDVRLLAEASDLVEMVIVHVRVDPEQPLEHLLYRVSEVLGEGSVCVPRRHGGGAFRSADGSSASTHRRSR